jgi:hypothetical protein
LPWPCRLSIDSSRDWRRKIGLGPLPIRAKQQADNASTGRDGVIGSPKWSCGGLAVALVACVATPALALDPRYPDWPCQQLKVPGISIAGVWDGPPIDNNRSGDSADPRQAELVAHLVARRTPMPEARQLIQAYITGTPEQKQQKATSLFAAAYAVLNGQRDQVMGGIERFSRKQKAMAAQIRENTQKIREIQDRPDVDPAQSEDLASQLTWQTRIFEDRRKTTVYMCDVPVLIEKRVFDLAKAIHEALNADAAAK